MGSPWSPVSGLDRLSYLTQSLCHSRRWIILSSTMEDLFSPKSHFIHFSAAEAHFSWLEFKTLMSLLFIPSFEIAGGSNFLCFLLFPGLTESYLAAFQSSCSFSFLPTPTPPHLQPAVPSPRLQNDAALVTAKWHEVYKQGCQIPQIKMQVPVPNVFDK